MTTEFHVQDVAISTLAAEYGTPLYIYDAEVIARQYHGLRSRLHPRVDIFYSLKANPNIAICALLRTLGARAEVSSLAELLTARRAGVTAEDIVFLGPGKRIEELAACLDQNIGIVVCESLEELALIDRLARERAMKAQVALRVNPAFSVKGAKLAMGGTSRQFGIDEEVLLADPAVATRFSSIELIGVHVYLGTRVLHAPVIAEHARRILQLAELIATTSRFPLEVVDIGGGLGVAYFDGEQDLDPDELTDLLNPIIETFATDHPHTRIVMELGRYLTAPAGIYVSRVQYIKESRGQRFAIVDGGTHHHMAAVGVGSFVKRNFPIALLSRTDAETDGLWNIAGPLCTPQDTLGRNVSLPTLERGDLIGVHRSGAYGPSASPVLFLGHGHPAEVLVHNGRPHLVRERDRPDDLLARQRTPDFLEDPTWFSRSTTQRS
ncbi:diaminopimelate decarboxylase [Nocardia asteroides]|uniref:diaminopimelate decarboxylase n=1 Tax=Nocardia asteroides TaxID=1824 RepID=UPI001E440B70|nr:diaminopimelate decarboxylase [Nocardia asteroides]UGT61026.1 diaminopimelate decarboxylase [Nocardia asteroides]